MGMASSLRSFLDGYLIEPDRDPSIKPDMGAKVHAFRRTYKPPGLQRGQVALRRGACDEFALSSHG
jgi:hypothetical protein